MIKKILLLAALALATQTSFAQRGFRLIEFGIKGGVDLANYDLSKSRLDGYRVFTDARTGYHVGLVSRINLIGIHIQPEINYHWNRFRLGSRDSNNATAKSKVNVGTMEVPVLVGIKLLFLRANLGPVFNIMNDSDLNSGRLADVVVRKPSVSYSAGLGLDIFDFSFDVRYNGQFTKAEQSIHIGSSSGDFKSNFRSWSFSLAYMF